MVYAIAPAFVLVWLAAAALGAAGASTDTAIVAIISEESTLEERGAALAGWNASTGLWGIGAPLAMSLLAGHGHPARGRGAGARPCPRRSAWRSTWRPRCAPAACAGGHRLAHGERHPGLRELALGR